MFTLDFALFLTCNSVVELIASEYVAFVVCFSEAKEVVDSVLLVDSLVVYVVADVPSWVTVRMEGEEDDEDVSSILIMS